MARILGRFILAASLAACEPLEDKGKHGESDAAATPDNTSGGDGAIDFAGYVQRAFEIHVNGVAFDSVRRCH